MIYNTGIRGFQAYDYSHKLFNVDMCYMGTMHVQKHLGELWQYKSSMAST